MFETIKFIFCFSIFFNSYIHAVNVYWVDDISTLFKEIFTTQSGADEYQKAFKNIMKIEKFNHSNLVKNAAAKIDKEYEKLGSSFDELISEITSSLVNGTTKKTTGVPPKTSTLDKSDGRDIKYGSTWINKFSSTMKNIYSKAPINRVFIGTQDGVLTSYPYEGDEISHQDTDPDMRVVNKSVKTAARRNTMLQNYNVYDEIGDIHPLGESYFDEETEEAYFKKYHKAVEDEITFRLESWFIGKPVYREIVIVIDSSISRTTDPAATIDLWKRTAEKLVNSFSEWVYFNVISSSSMVWDLKGKQIDHTVRALLCDRRTNCHEGDQNCHCGLFQANLINKNIAIRMIRRLKVRGGVDFHRALAMANKMLSSGKLCSKMIYLVTSVSEVDAQVRCSSGSNAYLMNRMRFVPGNTCKFDFKRLLVDVSIQQYLNQHTVEFHVFATTRNYFHYTKLAKLACRHGGTAIWLNSTKYFVDQFDLYNRHVHYSYTKSNRTFQMSYLLSSYQQPELFITAPLYLDDDNPLSMTGEEFIGVVGVEVKIEKIFSLIKKEFWNDANVFLVRPSTLTIVAHNLYMPMFQRYGLSLKTYIDPQNEVQNYEEIKQAVMERQTTSIKVKGVKKETVLDGQGFFRVPPYPSTTNTTLIYAFAPIPSLDLVLGFASSLSQRDEAEAQDSAYDGFKDYLLTFAEKPKRVSRSIEKRDTSNVDFEEKAFENIQIKKKDKGVLFEKRAFQNVTHFAYQFSKKFMNSLQEKLEKEPKKFLLSNALRDLKLSSLTWDKLNISKTSSLKTKIDDLVLSKRIITTSGIYRTLPNIYTRQSYISSIFHHRWYRDALVNKDQLSITQEYEWFGNTIGYGNTFSISQAVRYPCKDGNCDVFAVINLNIKKLLFVKRLTEFMNKKYDTQCGVGLQKCFLVRQNLDIEIELSPSNQSSTETFKNLNDLYPGIVRKMLQINVTVKKHVPKYYVECNEQIFKNLTKEKKVFYQLSEMADLPYWAGPCIQSSEEHILVHKAGEQLSLNFHVDEACFAQDVHVFSVPGTNLYFIVFHGSVSNFLCEENYIFTFESVSDSIDPDETCQYLDYVPIPCVVSKFPRILSLFVYFVSFFHIINI